jgi:hypothetical protein
MIMARKTINMLDKSETVRLAVYLSTNKDTLKHKTASDIATAAMAALGFKITKDNVGNMAEDAGLIIKGEAGVKRPNRRLDKLITDVAALNQRIEGYERSIATLEQMIGQVSEDLQKLELDLGGKILS